MKKLLIIVSCILWIAASIFAADSGSVFFQVRDQETGQPANLKLIDTGGGTKSPQVHLDSAVTLTDDTINFEVTDVTAAPGVTPSPTPARAFMMQGYTNGIPVPITEKKYVSTTKLAAIYTASHITTKTTTTPTSSTCYVSAIAICVSGAGSLQTLTIQNKEGTAKILYTAGAAIAVGNTYISFPEPILMTSGIDIITGGTTAGVQDVFITYWQ